MNDLGVWREGVYLAGDAVIETCAKSNQQIRVSDSHIGVIGAVHTEHSQRERVPRRETGHTHQGRRNRGLKSFRQLHQFSVSISQSRTTTNVEHGLLGREHHLDSFFDHAHVAAESGFVAAQFNLVGIFEFGRGHLDILGQIDDHRTGPTGPGNVEGLFDDAGQVLDVFDQVVMLGDRPGDADEVRLLEGIIANQTRWDLAGNDNHWNRIHISIGNSGNCVGCPGTTGCNGDTDPASRTRVTVGSMYGRLFVTRQDVLYG